MAKTIDLPFGGEVRKFRLNIAELRELQDKCNAGPATVLTRLMSYQPQASDFRRPRPDLYAQGISDPDFISDMNMFAMVRSLGGDWRVDDIRDTVRLGLIGAGATPSETFVLVSRYIDDAPGDLVANLGLAVDILNHALVGEVGDRVGKKPAGKKKPKATVA